jgi:hypothetical protein
MACLIAGNVGGKIATGRHLGFKPEDANARRLANRRNAPTVRPRSRFRIRIA